MLSQEAAPGEDEDPGVDDDDAFNLKLLEGAASKSIRNPTDNRSKMASTKSIVTDGTKHGWDSCLNLLQERPIVYSHLSHEKNIRTLSHSY